MSNATTSYYVVYNATTRYTAQLSIGSIDVTVKNGDKMDNFKTVEEVRQIIVNGNPDLSNIILINWIEMIGEGK